MLLIAALLPILCNQSPSFDREVLPILSDFCFPCHGPDAQARKASLRLDLPETTLRKNDPLVVPGKPEESELFIRMGHVEPSKIMPPPKFSKTLNAPQREVIRKWIATGAPWARHWAFVNPQIAPPPTVSDNGWPKQPLDRHVLKGLESKGIKPSPEADKATLLRRVTLDLTGLPPTPAEVAAFMADKSPDSYNRTVDRLLANPRYGERMAWDWLDAARYADTNGYQGDGERTMWPWRDWVAKAFNRNLPYDTFTLWQIAGDLIPDATDESRLATGFNRNYMINGEGGRIAEENRIDYLFDQAETVATVWLGLTFNCCRCHDHKFDSLPNRDYYRLMAFFNGTSIDGGGGNPQTPPILAVPDTNQASSRSALNKAVMEAEKAAGAIPKDNNKKIDAATAKIKALKEDLERLEKSIPKVMIMADAPKPRKTFILKTGLYNQPGEEVTPGVPSVLNLFPAGAPANRLGLARWLIAPENPLTARVTVNRVWTLFFGIGLVKTPEDFGVQGERPLQQELLDHLASTFRGTGWNMKQLVRTIVTSSTYRQSSQVSAASRERDPDNRLLARGPRFRLPSWMLRDQALATSGLLIEKVGGPPVKPYQPEGIWEEATFGNKKYVQDKGDALYRRTIYTFWRRIVGPTEIFDNAPRQVCSVKVYRTNTPLQALLTLNDTTYVEAARCLAQRVLLESGTDEARIRLMHSLVLCREPNSQEAAIMLASLKRHRQHFSMFKNEAEKLVSVGESERDLSILAPEHAAWTMIASTLLNLDETLNKE